MIAEVIETELHGGCCGCSDSQKCVHHQVLEPSIVFFEVDGLPGKLDDEKVEISAYIELPACKILLEIRFNDAEVLLNVVVEAIKGVLEGVSVQTKRLGKPLLYLDIADELMCVPANQVELVADAPPGNE